jgi:hypothetical protein
MHGSAVAMDAPGNTFAGKVVGAIGVIHFMGPMGLMVACLIGAHTPRADGDIIGDLPGTLSRR